MRTPTPNILTRKRPTSRRFTRTLAAASVLVVIALAGCGGSSGGSPPAANGSAPAANGAAPTSPTRAAPPSGASGESSNIPQGNGGDGDADNNGGPSDGDGNM